MLRLRFAFVVFAVAPLLFGGCGGHSGDAVIVNHPDWAYDQYERIGVLPAEAKVGGPEGKAVAKQVESYLITALADSGAFSVSARSDFAKVMTEHDLALLAGAGDSSGAIPEVALQVAQAIVVIEITECKLDQERRTKEVPVIQISRRGIPQVVGKKLVNEYRNVARVGGSVRVTDIATDTVLMSYSVPAIEKDAARDGSPPDESPRDLAQDLARELAVAFARKIAPQRVTVELDKDSLVIASAYFEGQYEELSTIPRDLPELLLVARDLPPACDRNDFRLAISPEGAHSYLVQHEFTWSPSKGQRGEVVKFPVEKLLASGSENFVAKLFSIGNETPIIERPFKLEKPGK